MQTALLWGDPHFRTLDDLKYTFNGIGEFWMIKTSDSSFGLQVRTEQTQRAGGVSYAASSFVAFVAQESAKTAKVEVRLNNAQNGRYFICSYHVDYKKTYPILIAT